MYKSGDTFRDEIYVYDADGALATPDSIDAAVLVVNGTDTAVSVTTDTSTAGIIKVSCSLAGRSAGDQFWVRVTATVDGVQQIIRTAIGRIGVNVVQWGDQSINAAQMTAGIIHAVAVDTSGSSLSTPIDAIKAKTDNLPASPAAQDKLDVLESRLTSARAGYLDKLNVSGTLAHSDDADTYKADVSGLSTLDAAGIRAAIGLASANLDEQLSAIPSAAAIAAAVDSSLQVTLADVIAWGAAGLTMVQESGTVPGAYQFTSDAVSEIDVGDVVVDLGDVEAALATLLARTSAGVSITYSGPVSPDGRSIELYAGADYHADDGRALEWSIANYQGADPETATAKLLIVSHDKYDGEGEISTPDLEADGTASYSDGTLSVSVNLTAEQTAQLESSPPHGKWNAVYQLIITDSGRRWIAQQGRVWVRRLIGVSA